jgi:hypothetical protein
MRTDLKIETPHGKGMAYRDEWDSEWNISIPINPHEWKHFTSDEDAFGLPKVVEDLFGTDIQIYNVRHEDNRWIKFLKRTIPAKDCPLCGGDGVIVNKMDECIEYEKCQCIGTEIGELDYGE